MAALIEVYQMYYEDEVWGEANTQSMLAMQNLICAKIQTQFAAYQKHEVLIYIQYVHRVE